MQAGVGSEIDDRYVAAPVPPDASDSWYAPEVCAQYEIYPDVVVTVRRTHGTTTYEVREPRLPERGQRAVNRFTEHFAGDADPPPTREGVIDRMSQGFPPKYERVFERLVAASFPFAVRRRIEYHALAHVRCLEDLTPYALDERLTERTAIDGELVVETPEYAAMRTGQTIDTERRCYQRLLSERCQRYTVSFLEFEIPVVVYRAHTSEVFTTSYAVCEPELLPGDGELLKTCKERLWQTNVNETLVRNGFWDRSQSDLGTSGSSCEHRDRITFVRDRAKQLIARRLTAQTADGWLDSLRHRLYAALSEHSQLDSPRSGSVESDRLNDLLYYVLRDFIGYERLTIPIYDDRLEDIEANCVGDNIKVVLRGAGRTPTNICFESEETFSNVVTQLAAADGVELNASTPSAKVNIDPVGRESSRDETIRCALALGTISEGGPHVSIRKQRSDPLTPVELVQNGAIPTALVALLWLVFEHHGVVLFSGPTGVGKTTLMNAHISFIPHDDRPISIDEGSREVRVPHETGVSLRTRDHQKPNKRVSMADLMTESNYLNPDVEIIAEINTPESFATFGESISTGHGIVGTTHAETIERLTNRVIEQGLPPHLLPEIDLVVFPRHIDGERYVGTVVELVSDTTTGSIDATTIERDGVTVAYNTVLQRTSDGEFTTQLENPMLELNTGEYPQLFERLADRTDIPLTEIRASFRQKHRFVRSLVAADVTEIDVLFERLARYEEHRSGGT